MTPTRNYFEIWSRPPSGDLRCHGRAPGMTFDDACKHLACESLDFWTHFDRGRYQGDPLFASRHEAQLGRVAADGRAKTRS